MRKLDVALPKEALLSGVIRSHEYKLLPDATEAQRRARLARFGLDYGKAETEAGNLSGGEKARLALALIVWQAPNLLVLDEPTNDLDLETLDLLEERLRIQFAAADALISTLNNTSSFLDRQLASLPGYTNDN